MLDRPCLFSTEYALRSARWVGGAPVKLSPAGTKYGNPPSERKCSELSTKEAVNDDFR